MTQLNNKNEEREVPVAIQIRLNLYGVSLIITSNAMV